MTKLADDSEFAGQEPFGDPDPEIDRLWLEEAERRLAAYRAGKVEAIPAEEIFGEE